MMRYDAAVLDRQFNNRELVPDWADYLARWKRDSQEARLNWPCLLDLPYGDSIAQTLDWFAPAATGLAPCLVFIHGGWWRSLDKADHSFIAPPFVARGVHVVVVNYALAPGAPLQQIVGDVVQALAWVWRRAEDFGVDRSRIVLAGHSAGAHLAAMMLACRFDWYGDDLPAQIPAGALALSGVYDLEAVRKTAFLQRDLKLTQHSARAMSPAWLPPAGPAALALAVGADESEAFHAQARLMHRHWPGSGKTLVVPGAHHFSALDALAQPGSVLHSRLWDLIGTRERERVSETADAANTVDSAQDLTPAD
ncbi:MAG: alpha/beta hydrolase [Betaproteobacteria bacterium]|jgi:arylformamidase|uniref:alpha/beta hydrolase n=1 Tax=unclassified Thiomonas TaxID=2625466 RepID=UPI000BC5A7FC|nr:MULTISPECIES: alpha/beta hydrolase [unclassified Thiomonas]MDE2175211.1 alpha/beta hydrolase [Betaproteobacteria bacterium]OZB69607.1 MAG: arylformamidase [Thiomonas sp. 13-64-67]